jgi:phage terminase small subunit
MDPTSPPTTPPTPALRPKQVLFIQEYLKDMNATQAAVRAGYSAHTAHVIGRQNLMKTYIAAAIRAAQQERLAELGVNHFRVLQEIARLAFVDARKLYDEHGQLRPVQTLDDDTAAAVAGLDVSETWSGDGDECSLTRTKKLRLWSKTDNLKLLAQHLRLLQEAPDAHPVVTVQVLYGTAQQTSLI